MCVSLSEVRSPALLPEPRLHFALAASRPYQIARAGRGWARRQRLAGRLRGAGRTRANASWSRAIPARTAGWPAAAQHGAAGRGPGRAGAGASPGLAGAVMTLLSAALLALVLVVLCALLLGR